MFTNWKFPKLFDRSETISKETDSSDPAWMVFKIGGFKIESSKASLQALSPVLPILMRFLGRSLPYLACVIVGGIGTASLDNALLPTPPTEAEVSTIEKICPIPQEEQP